MVLFNAEFRTRANEDQADLRFVPVGSERAMTYIDQRSKRLVTMVNVSEMARDCPDTIQLMARHEACHVVLHGARLVQLSDEHPLGAEERMRMETQAGICALQDP